MGVQLLTAPLVNDRARLGLARRFGEDAQLHRSALAAALGLDPSQLGESLLVDLEPQLELRLKVDQQGLAELARVEAERGGEGRAVQLGIFPEATGQAEAGAVIYERGSK